MSLHLIKPIVSPVASNLRDLLHALTAKLILYLVRLLSKTVNTLVYSTIIGNSDYLAVSEAASGIFDETKSKEKKFFTKTCVTKAERNQRKYQPYVTADSGENVS